ncbi:MAG: choline ABC transporter ATP-binding protein [Desulfobacterales bacterium]|nr:MAG: choline ABC transporter ATP-binding protein [Desulfobacterales bacterium]
MPVVSFEHVDVIFGPNPTVAVDMLDQGKNRDDIFAKTENLVAVHDATIDVQEGEICVLMGLSGSGKSSLIRCVNGLNKITRGHLNIRHKDTLIDLATCDWSTLHNLRTERISMVFQQFALMPWRTVRDNVALGLELSGVPKNKRHQIVEEKLALVRLDNWADKFPRELSGGMQQRVGLARALATDADILLMDEPFSALDPLIREHLQDELIQLQKDLKKTIIFVSHDLDEALKLGNLIAIMEGGKIVQIGSPEDIVSNPVNEYVAQFVASMNPLKVLSCASLMRPVETLENDDRKTNSKIIDPKNQTICTLDDQGRLQKVTHSGNDISMISFKEDLDLKTLPKGTIVTADADTPMRAAVEINFVVGLPLPVIDRIGKLIGVVGNKEIFSTILGKTNKKKSMV